MVNCVIYTGVVVHVAPLKSPQNIKCSFIRITTKRATCVYIELKSYEMFWLSEIYVVRFSVCKYCVWYVDY